ncbi:hypothetical protein BDK51DRAFT_24474, partial [Blyttiomyces helicus]
MTTPAPKPPTGSQFKLKQRKREAVTKYEPNSFRDSFLKIIPEDATELAKYSQTLEINESKIDYKFYAEPLFELLIVGGLIAPGGIVEEGPRRNPFSIFAGEDSRAAIRARVDILIKLTRRYKYLEKKLEDTLVHLLQYVNKFGDDAAKLATAVGMLTAMQLCSMGVLVNLIKDHLVKDGASLRFATGVFKSYLDEQSIDHLSATLKKSGIDNKLLDFFPPNKREEEYLTRHFESEGLKPLVDYFRKRQQFAVKDKTGAELKEMFGSAGVPEVIAYIKQQVTANSWNEQDVIPLIWDAMMGAVDWSNRPEQIESQLVRQLTV